MRISVAIPTYERSSSVAALLGDLAGQVRPADEVIIVDDTPDASVEMVARNAGVGYVRNAGLPGIPQARNVALDHIGGGVVLFLDSDVRLDKGFIAAIEDALEHHPDAPGAMGHVVSYPANPIRRRILRLLLLSHARKDRCGLLFPPRMVYPQPLTRELRTNFLFGCNMAYRMTAIGSQRFDESMRRYAYMEDLEFSSRIHAQARSDYVITPHARLDHLRDSAGRIGEVDLFRMRLVNKYYLAYARRLRPWHHVALKAQDIGNLLWYGFFAPLKSLRYAGAMVHVWWMVARHRNDLLQRRLDRFNAHYAFALVASVV